MSKTSLLQPNFSFPAFWKHLEQWGDAPALITTDGSGLIMTYDELATLADAIAEHLNWTPLSRQVILLPVANSVSSMAVYLAALRSQQVIFPYGQPTDNEFFAEILTRYQPDWIIYPDADKAPERLDGYRRLSDSGWWRGYTEVRYGLMPDALQQLLDKQVVVDTVAFHCLAAEVDQPVVSPSLDEMTSPLMTTLAVMPPLKHLALPVPHDDLSLLLTTSGSTGNPKLVRLSAKALAANAWQIAQALTMTQTERAITTLSMAYSFGLSVINSHLLVGASLVLSDRSLLDPDFWPAVAEYQVTTMAGVPFSYDVLRRTGAEQKAPACLVKLLQAGGRMNPKMIAWTRSAFAGAKLYVMYGQTEATARLSVLPPDEAEAGHGSVGYALPKGTFSIDDDGQVVYCGPNVMMGYAYSRADLVQGDTLESRLVTGDVGYLDPDGRLWLTGRISRIVKPFGVRVSLDDLERHLAHLGTIAVCGDDTGLDIFIEQGDADSILVAAKNEVQALQLPPTIVRVHDIDAIPRSANGKVLYAALQQEKGAGSP